MRTIHVGLGPIGQQIATAAVESGIAQPVAAVDLHPDLHGKSLGALVGHKALDGVEILPDLHAALAAAGPAATAVVLATGSRLPEVAPQITAAIDHGLNVVSTSEELVWPWLRHPRLADELDAAARLRGVTVIGTGINPGFLLDALPLLLCRSSLAVRRILAKRIVNVSLRRPQLQQKVGSGLDPETYRRLAKLGQVGHVGLGESAALLAAGLGWKHDGVQEAIEPVIAREPTGTEHFPVEPGQVMGSHQTAFLATDDGRAIELICRMTHGEPSPRDEIIVDGDPWMCVRIEGGIFGDTATAACVVNILRHVADAQAGLLTVKDLPLGWQQAPT